MIAFYGCILNRSVHSLDLAIGPRVTDLGEPVLNALSVANTVKGDFPVALGSFTFGELNAIVCQQGVDGIRHSVDQVGQEISCNHPSRLWVQFGIGEL